MNVKSINTREFSKFTHRKLYVKALLKFSFFKDSRKFLLEFREIFGQKLNKEIFAL